MRFRAELLSLFACLAVFCARAADSQVHTTPANDQERVAVTQLTNGTVVFVWEDESTGVPEVWFRLLNSSLTPLNAPARAWQVLNPHQSEPVVAPLTNGFVIAWTARQQPGIAYDVVYRRFDFNGNPFDAEPIQANTTETGDQHRPDITALTPGGFVIVWDDQSGAYAAGSDQDIRYRRFNGNGTPMDPNDLVANAWGVNARVLGNQGHGRVAALPGGGFVITYEDRQTDDVLAVRFDGSGNPLPAPGLPSGSRQFTVNQQLAFEQTAPAVSSFSNGAFVVVFNSETNGTPASRRVVARFFTPSGVASNEVVLGSFANRTQDARVTALPNGTFAVAMQAINLPSEPVAENWSILAQRVHTNGTSLTPSFIANSFQPDDQERPAIAALRDGSYVVAWQSFAQDGSGWGVFAQRFTAAGEPGGGRLLIARQNPAGTNFLVTFTNGAAYVPYRLQGTTNLVNWTTLRTTNSSSGSFQYLDNQGGTVRSRSYRVVTP